MKTLEILNYLLLVLAAMLAVTAIFAFVNGHIIYGICNILWMGCEIIFSLVNKHSIEIKQEKLKVYGFLSAMDDTIKEYGSAIITEDEDGGRGWQMGNNSRRAKYPFMLRREQRPDSIR